MQYGEQEFDNWVEGDSPSAMVFRRAGEAIARMQIDLDKKNVDLSDFDTTQEEVAEWMVCNMDWAREDPDGVDKVFELVKEEIDQGILDQALVTMFNIAFQSGARAITRFQDLPEKDALVRKIISGTRAFTMADMRSN